jgi:hypothetical protein
LISTTCRRVRRCTVYVYITRRCTKVLFLSVPARRRFGFLVGRQAMPCTTMMRCLSHARTRFATEQAGRPPTNLPQSAVTSGPYAAYLFATRRRFPGP